MLTLSQKAGILKDTELFAEMDSESLNQIAEALENVSYERDDVIMREGEPGDALYAVVEGEVILLKEEIHVLTLGKGAVVGEMALLDGKPRSATIVAGTDVVTLRLTRSDFERLVFKSRAMMEGMNRLLTNKLRYDLDVHVDTIRKQEQFNQDIKRAREVQQAMLPQSDYAKGALAITGYCMPADSVGGDYYDYLEVSDDAVALFIGDVTGHGFYSGLIVAVAKSCIVTRVATDPSVESVVRAMNRVVHEVGADWMFMTACYALLNLRDKTFVYGNSGHNSPYHYHMSTGKLAELSATDPPLGIFDETTCAPRTAHWEHGDTLIFYSDGVVEAENEIGDLMGEARLESCIHRCVHLSAMEIKQAILAEVDAFTGGTRQKDDVTLMIARL
ncbi:MAG: SpoIIE family protein phosphatase [Candidatus Latescibacteria bacterium]|nr:SpoIIE family protein phosphatase [Candidatus Latescibacterota bacterium]